MTAEAWNSPVAFNFRFGITSQFQSLVSAHPVFSTLISLHTSSVFTPESRTVAHSLSLTKLAVLIMLIFSCSFGEQLLIQHLKVITTESNSQMAEDKCFLVLCSEGYQYPSGRSSTHCCHRGNMYVERGIVHM